MILMELERERKKIIKTITKKSKIVSSFSILFVCFIIFMLISICFGIIDKIPSSVEPLFAVIFIGLYIFHK